MPDQPASATGKQATLQPESVGLEAQQPSLFPHEMWEFDESQESPRDLTLRTGNRLTIPDGIVTNDFNVQRDLDVDRNLNVDGLGVVDGTMLISGVTTLAGGKRVGVASTSTTPFTFTDTDGIEFLLVTTGASAFTVNLPTAADNTGRVITIRKVDTGAGKITVDGEGSETIDGNATVGIWYPNNFLTLLCTGTAWLIVGATNPVLIPELSRPTAWVLNGGSATAFTDVDFGSYTPPGRKALYLTYSLQWVGNGTRDDSQAWVRMNGSGTGDADQMHRMRAYFQNLGSGFYADVTMELPNVWCDTNGVIEYTVTAADADYGLGILYLNIKGYSMMG